MLTLPINSTLFIISNCSNRKNQLITPLWIKKLTKHKRLNKINSRHMQDKQLLLEARHQQIKQQHERVYRTQSQKPQSKTQHFNDLPYYSVQASASN